MTTSSVMSLPADIAWKRLALDKEMMWFPPRPGHPSIYPDRWNPSVTIFYAQPDPELLPQDYQDTTITYIKVVCSITGTTLLPGELAQGQPWPVDSPPAEIIANNLARYFGCYGAVLEVDTVPYGDADSEAITYPYFVDFEPKKRELYEAVTQSGETLSDSKEALSIRKSITNLESQERATGALPSTVPEFKTELKEEYANVRNIDASREARETVSHTTQLSQMYHLLDAYHLGTNRALFFLQPRPHDADPQYQTFLAGPRRLEGIQEFFLVIAQPKSRAGLCVSASLSTGHLAFGKTEPTAIGPQTKDKPFDIPYVHDPYWKGPSGLADSQEKRYELGNQLWPPDLPRNTSTDVWIDPDVNKGTSQGWEDVKGDLAPVMKGPGWTLRLDAAHCKLLSSVKSIDVLPDASGITVASQIQAVATGETYAWGRIQATLTVALKVKTPATPVEGRETIDFFMRSKNVGACLDGQGQIHPHPPTDVSWESRVAKLIGPRELAGNAKPGAGELGALRALNEQITEAIRDANKQIYPHGPGPVSNPLHTDYALKRLRDALPLVRDREWLETPAMQIEAVPADVKPYLARLDIRDRRELLDMSPQDLRHRLQQAGLELSETRTRDLYLSAWDIIAGHEE